MALLYLVFMKTLKLTPMHQDKQQSFLQDKATTSQPEKHHQYKWSVEKFDI